MNASFFSFCRPRFAAVLGCLAAATFSLPAIADGGSTTYTITDLGTLPGGTTSAATAINASGQVVGQSSDSSGSNHAFLYSNGQMTNLGTLPGDTRSTATGLNASGQIVGTSSGSGAAHVFLYSKGKMTDLTVQIPASSGWTLDDATGINDSGLICGTGEINGQTHAFLLTPSLGPAVRPLAAPKPAAAHR